MSGHHKEVRWAFNTLLWHPSREAVLRALSSVSCVERDRLQKFHFKRDFKASLAGRLMIRKCIHTQLDIPWTDVQLGRTEKGKPILTTDQHQSRLSFNVSHQGAYAVLAASRVDVVGVDVMDSSRPNNTTIDKFFKLMRRQFTEPEWRFIQSWTDEPSQLQAFYRLWCLKESVVKAQGGGLGTSSAERMRFDIRTRCLSVGRSVTDSVLYEDGEQSQGWRFTETKLDEEHVATVASVNSVNATVASVKNVNTMVAAINNANAMTSEHKMANEELFVAPEDINSRQTPSNSTEDCKAEAEISVASEHNKGNSNATAEHNDDGHSSNSNELKDDSINQAETMNQGGGNSLQFHFLSESELLEHCAPLCEPDEYWFEQYQMKK